MNFVDFQNTTLSYWNSYLEKLYNNRQQIKSSNFGTTILFPTMALMLNFDDFYAIELIGVSKHFKKLVPKIHKEKSIYKYISQFKSDHETPTFEVNENARFKNICFSNTMNFEIIKEKYPFVDIFQSRIVRKDASGSSIKFSKATKFCAIENSIFVNNFEMMTRCKSVLALYIFSKSVNNKDIRDYFNDFDDNFAHGVHTVATSDEQNLLIASQLQNLILTDKIHETTIGEFIKNHPNIINSSFKSNGFYYEPFLKWCANNEDSKFQDINPDLLVKRNDGFYDIYDLKTAKLDKTKLTKGKHSRRRFVDYVEEGMAQLANYRAYFEFNENKDYAKLHYDIEVRNPKLVLVVGTWENVDITEVHEACRRYSNIEVIDYDTLTHLFLKS